MKSRLSAAAVLVALSLPAFAVSAVAQQPPPVGVPAPETAPAPGTDAPPSSPPPPPVRDARPDRGPPPYMGMRAERHGGGGRHWRRFGDRQGAEFTVREDAGGTTVEVKCAADEPMKACADIMMMLLDRVGQSDDATPPVQ